MLRRYFIANWKSHMLLPDVDSYLSSLKENISTVNLEENVFVICPGFTLLDFVSKKIVELEIPVQVGAQNISEFGEGAYTGEVFGEQIKELATHVIIGHSERKRYAKESDEQILKKAEQAHKSGLSIIQCVQDENSIISDFADIIAYEPPSAISTFGTGVPDDPRDVERVLAIINQKRPGKILLYGGSVNHETIKMYDKIENCSGFLVGSASLEAQTFLSLSTAC